MGETLPGNSAQCFVMIERSGMGVSPLLSTPTLHLNTLTVLFFIMTQSLTTLWSSRIENKKEEGASKRTDFSKTGRTPLPSSNFPLCPLTILVGGILTSSTDFSWQEFRFMQIVFCDHLQLYYASQNQSKVTSMLKVS